MPLIRILVNVEQNQGSLSQPAHKSPLVGRQTGTMTGMVSLIGRLGQVD